MVSPAAASAAAAAPHNQQQQQQQTHKSSQHRPCSILAPLAPVFYILNWIAFIGWCNVLYQLISFYYSSSPATTAAASAADGGTGAALQLQLLLQGTKSTLVLLEGICVVEVGRIFFKDLPGNLTCK
jgi:hypothetical protein